MLSDPFISNTLRPLFSHALSLKLETINLDAFIRNFSKGQTLPAKIVQVLPENKAVVEIRGEKLLLQFPHSVLQGQNISIKIEQMQPNLVLKLTDFPSSGVTKTNLDQTKTETFTPNQKTDTTSFQSRAVDTISKIPVANKDAGPVAKDGQIPSSEKTPVLFSNTDLNQLNIRPGNKMAAEVIRVVETATLQVRLNGNDIIVKHASPQVLKPGDSVYVHARPVSAGKFEMVVEPQKIPSINIRPPIELSILKNYLPARQPMPQMFAALKEIFLEGAQAQLKELNIKPVLLKQLQDNLQVLASKEIKTPDAAQLKEMIDRSGVHYEARVKDFISETNSASKNLLLENDLKGQLMRVAQDLKALSTGTKESRIFGKVVTKLVSQVNQAINNIELQQLIHHFSREEHQPLLIQLPDNLMGEENRFRIYVLPEQKDDSESSAALSSRPFSLVFLLNLSALEDLRIEANIVRDQVSIHIVGTNPDVVQFIQSHALELETLFHEHGFSINVSSDHSTEVSMEAPDSLGQLLVDTPLQVIDLET